MAHGNGKDLVASLVRDVEELKESTRQTTHELRSLGERMSSLSDTIADVAKTMGVMAKAILKQSERSSTHEKLYGRLAKTLIAFKSSTDERFGRIELRLDELEATGSRH